MIRRMRRRELEAVRGGEDGGACYPPPEPVCYPDRPRELRSGRLAQVTGGAEARPILSGQTVIGDRQTGGASAGGDGGACYPEPNMSTPSGPVYSPG